MRAATDSVGLVSPRSTCDSIGADTPERSARSRSDRSIASRSARTRGPMWIWWSSCWSATAMTRAVRYHVQASTAGAGAGRAPTTLAGMARSALLRPDVLVLAGGGIVGEAWMHGVLAGLEDAGGADFREVEAYVGTSAGSIVAARLASGRRPPRPGATSARHAAPGLADEVAADEEPPVSAPADGDAGAGAARSAVRDAVRDAARLGWAASAPVTGAALAISAPAGALARAAILGRAAGHGHPLTQLESRVARWG